ncbi:Calcineurin-like phosphoesterase [Mariniphaga anaerophila]|uniref:Calcineurin-like phosphoesterase n=1 Tax=Mariniphaga anaerophila TaxID=1484053 RepID=A0A1M4T7H5_9BACT|nr:metallophosphoesterase [Mariniphaga anaerophila]SHE40446.1 Calcineurin-like phosphoesterase [Mariniphaga anaerophila]
MKRINWSGRFLMFPLLFLFLLSACVQQKVMVTAVVKDESGEPVDGLKGRFQEKSKFSESLFLKHASRKENGLFELKVKPNEPYVLELRGDEGAGRILLQPDRYSDTVQIAYPIKEKIVFLHTNDQHFDLNYLQELFHKVEEIRAENNDVYLFSAGDMVVRHPHRWFDNGELQDSLWYAARAKLMIEKMNELEYDLMTLGNHELDYIGDYTRQALELADFPLLAANLKVSTENLPATVPYSVLETSTARKVAVLGLSKSNTKKDGVAERNLDKTITRYHRLKNKSDVFLILSHRGLKEDKILAEKYPVFDAIIGGHSHDLLEEPLVINSVLVAQAGGNPHIVSDDRPVYLGKVVFILENGKVTGKSGLVIRINE